MSDDSDFDEIAHERLLKSISTGKVAKVAVRKELPKVRTDDLLSSLSTAKQSTLAAQKSVAHENRDAKWVGSTKTLAAPVHRQARERIQGAVGFIELKKDLNEWIDIVDANRLADQLSFPLHQERVLTTDTGADKVDAFRPKTEMEIEMAKLLNNSKNNLKNDTVYTEKELEIIKAMNLKEAKRKLNDMQKMRAIVSYREAKFKYAAKIKSKGYHRLLKREKRKQLVKEFDDLLVRDPEAAKKKLEEIEEQRILERASLKHHARSKFQQEIVKHAGRDPVAKKVLEDHLKLGRELRSKVAPESDDENSEDPPEKKKQTVGDIIKSAALAAATADDYDEKAFDIVETRKRLYELRVEKRIQLANSKVNADGSIGVTETPQLFEVSNDWEVEKQDEIRKPETSVVEKKPKKKAKRAKSTDEVVVAEPKKNISELFDDAENQMVRDIQKEAAELRASEVSTDEPVKKKKKTVQVKKEDNKNDTEKIDLALDPANFLQVETSNLSKVSADLTDKMDEFEEEQSRLVAEAFKDDDVIGEFAAEKERTEEGERPKDIDLTLQGWGSWAGPGISEKKRRKRFVLKAREKKRRDKGKGGVIIKETDDSTIRKLQPNSLPFPYTRVEDFERVVSQPIGKDWNPVSVSRDLCKPAIVTQAGRSIRPINKEEAIKKKMHDSDDEI